MSRRIVYIVGAILIAVVLAALAGWYFFLERRGATLADLSAGRGFGDVIPFFNNSSGSTFENIIDGFRTDEEGGEEEVQEAPRLWRVNPAPAADISFTRATNTSAYVIDRATGYVFEAAPHNSSFVRLTNTLVPNVNEATWASGTRVLLRHLNDRGSIVTFSGALVAASSTEEAGRLNVAALEPNIIALTSRIEQEDIFYIAPHTSGVVGILAAANGQDTRRIWDSMVSGWQPYLLEEGGIALVQNASSGVLGSAYVVSESGTEPLITNKRGLSVAIANASDPFLYSTAHESELRLFARSSAGETPIPLNGIAQKCVISPVERNMAFCAVPENFSPNGYPDTWYRGEVHSSDRWWRVDMSTGAVEFMLSPEAEYGVAIDVLDPTIDPSGRYIAFLDATTMTPWMLRIEP